MLHLFLAILHIYFILCLSSLQHSPYLPLNWTFLLFVVSPSSLRSLVWVRGGGSMWVCGVGQVCLGLCSWVVWIGGLSGGVGLCGPIVLIVWCGFWLWQWLDHWLACSGGSRHGLLWMWWIVDQAMFVWLLFDVVRDWRFGFRFERWDFEVVCGLILACGHGGGGGGDGGCDGCGL